MGRGMGRRSAILALTLIIGLTVQHAQAENLRFTFIDVEYLRLDIDKKESITSGSDTLTLKTDDDRGYRVAAAWQFFRGFHVFGEFEKAENIFKTRLTGPLLDITNSEKVDVTRSRLGAGYGLPLGGRWLVYSRVTWDHVDVDNLQLGPVSLGNDDDDGTGAEVGLRWQLLPSLELQGYGQYSSVGKYDVDDGFDDDALGGIKIRWNAFGSEDLAFQMGYQHGDMKSYTLGMRFIF